MNDRRADRYDPQDTDPLRALSDEDYESFAHQTMRDTETRDELRSGFAIVWLLLAIVAGAAIALLWWTFR